MLCLGTLLTLQFSIKAGVLIISILASVCVSGVNLSVSWVCSLQFHHSVFMLKKSEDR